jgi:hypothetical protein
MDLLNLKNDRKINKNNKNQYLISSNLVLLQNFFNLNLILKKFSYFNK